MSVRSYAFVLLAAGVGASNPAAAQWADNSGPRWNGFYGGIHGGVAASSLQAMNSVSGISDTAKGGGLQGGLLAGFNYQIGPVVLGIEADGTLTGIEANHTPVVGALGDTISWGASLRGRLGVPVGTVLFYGTGGLALADTKVTLANVGSRSNIQTGLIGGLGAEAQLFAGWRLRGEYLYSRMEANRYSMANGAMYDVNSGTHTLRAAIVVRFGY